MATSPKKKTKTSRQQQQQQTPRFHLWFIFVYVLSFVVALFIIVQQREDIRFYAEYIEEIGKAEKPIGFDESKLEHRGSGERNYGNDKKVTVISILGERNSGTTWVYEHLSECFNHTVNVQRRLKRYKHWFQDESVGKPIIDGTLVITVFRNPFEWVEGMRKKPHHAPEHMFKEWKEFVSKPWTMKRVGKDLEMTDLEKEQGCQEYFNFHDLISCHVRPYPDGTFNKTHYSEHQPFYEMRNDGSGKPFDNILEMRAAKIRNFLSTKDFEGVTDFWIQQYEVLVSLGTDNLIRKIEDLTGAHPTCEPSPPQKERKRRRIDPELLNYLMDHLDWEAENLVGYHKSGVRKPTGR